MQKTWRGQSGSAANGQPRVSGDHHYFEVAHNVVGPSSKSSKMPRATSVHISRLATVLLVCSAALLAQNPQLRTKNGRRFPTVTFTSVYWSGNPTYYSIAIDATGAATYQSAPDSTSSIGVPYTIEFQTSDSTRRVTFNIARELDFLNGDFPISLRSAANAPVRTLAYHDTTFNNQITYSDSTDSEIQELTSVFEEISATFEFARRLAYLHQYDRGGLEPELVRMQTSAEHHLLRELQAVTPALKSITSDPSLSESVRKRAEAILALVRKI